MPIRKTEPRTLLEIFAEYSPQVMSNGQIRMMCPFRDNHTDGSGRYSFFVSPDINAYHCFSCGAKGNLVRLLTTVFKVRYYEAIGMVSYTDYKKEKTEFDLDVMWDLNRFPKEFLDRGFSVETLKHFRVGMSGDEILIPYYRDFNKPIELLGYQRRWYSPDRGVRNSKSFDKEHYLYNLNFDYAYTVLVEGQSDVWRLYQYGYNATALMGLTISDWQVEQLSKFERVYLALDNDEAGRKGTEVVNFCLGKQTEILLVPYDAKDPGECGRKKWKKAFESATDYLVYSMEMSMEWDAYLDVREEALEPFRKRPFGKLKIS